MSAAVVERRLASLEAVVARLDAGAARRWASPLDLAAALGLALDPWQRRVLASTARRVVVLAPRQVGKSLCAGLLGLHVALGVPEALVLLIAPAQRQSVELARVVRRLAGSAGAATAERAEAVAPTALSVTRIEFPNGARVVALPGASEATVRGFSAPALVVVDEASRLGEDTFAAVRPMLVARPAARLVLASTPFLKTGTFHAACHDETGAWERHRVRVGDCPRLSAEYLAQERAALPPWVFAREYLGEFADDVATVFPAEMVDAAVDPGLAPLFPQRRAG